MFYAILKNSDYNKISFTDYFKLEKAELEAVLVKMSSGCDAVSKKEIGGLEYITFRSDGELSQNDIAILNKLSFEYALFKCENSEFKKLEPINIYLNNFAKNKISSMMKYSGKTNEYFTHLLINLAMSASQTENNQQYLIDPLAGKGTTLYEALSMDCNVAGVEIGTKVADESVRFFKKYLETERIKHRYKKLKMSGVNKSFIAQKHDIVFSMDKDDEEGKFSVIAGNTLYTDKYFNKKEFDLLVSDLPYGVQHSSVTNEKQNSFTRNPDMLLTKSLPIWKNVLKKGAGIAISWNSHVIKKENIVDIFEENGFTVLKNSPYDDMKHRVNASIIRDVLVARL